MRARDGSIPRDQLYMVDIKRATWVYSHFLQVVERTISTPSILTILWPIVNICSIWPIHVLLSFSLPYHAEWLVAITIYYHHNANSDIHICQLCTFYNQVALRYRIKTTKLGLLWTHHNKFPCVFQKSYMISWTMETCGHIKVVVDDEGNTLRSHTCDLIFQEG